MIDELSSEMQRVTASAIASAPGRLDVMGGISDYSGSLLLQMPIKERTIVTILKIEGERLIINSEGKKSVMVAIDDLCRNGKWSSITQIQNSIKKEDKWSLYVLGCTYLFCQHYNLPLVALEFTIDSQVPIGKGVSSSASLEVATLLALCKIYRVLPEDQFLPMMAQKAENTIVGAPCGLMDQLAVYWGRKNELLPLVCQPAKIDKTISIPDGLYFMAIDSGVSHSVSGNLYADARVASFMAYSIIEQSLGTPLHALEIAKTKGDVSRLVYGGYISNIRLDQYEEKFADIIPSTISGAEFIQKFGGVTDSLSKIEPQKKYYPRNCGSHPIYENNRIERFAELLKEMRITGAEVKKLTTLGNLMYASHEGYSKCGLGHARTDEIVALAKKSGKEKGVYGARVTGGGSGGAVCLLVDEKGKEEVYSIQASLSEKYKKELYLFKGSSDGAKYID